MKNLICHVIGCRSLVLVVGVMLVFFGDAFVNAQTTRTASEFSVYKKQVNEIAERAMAPMKKDGRFLGVAGGGGGDATRPEFMMLEFAVNMAIPGSGQQKYRIELIRFRGAGVAKKSAEFQVKRLKAPLPVTKRPIVGRLGGEGELGVGDSSYYLGTTATMREGSAYVNHKHESFAQQGTWLVKVHAQSFKKERSASIKAMQKELLENFIASATGTKPRGSASTPAAKKIEVRQPAGAAAQPAGDNAEAVWGRVFKSLTDKGLDQGEFMKPRVWRGQGYRRLKVWRKLTVQNNHSQVFSIGLYRFDNVDLAMKELEKRLANLSAEEKNEKGLVFTKLDCHGRLPVGNGGFLKAHEMEMRYGGNPRKAYQYYSVVLSGNWVFTMDSVGNEVNMSQGVGERVKSVLTQLVEEAAAKKAEPATQPAPQGIR